MEAVKQPKDDVKKPQQEYDVDANGDVVIPTQKVIGTAAEVFGEKLYAVPEDELDDILERAETETEGFSQEESLLKDLTEKFKVTVAEPMLDKAKERFGGDLTKKAQEGLKRSASKEVEVVIKKATNEFRITHSTLDLKEEKELAVAKSCGESGDNHQVRAETPGSQRIIQADGQHQDR